MQNVFVKVNNSKFELNLKLCDNKNYCYLLLGLITFKPLLIICKENKIRSTINYDCLGHLLILLKILMQKKTWIVNHSLFGGM